MIRLEPVGGQVTQTDPNLRETPVVGKVLATIPKNSVLFVKETQGRWVKVDYKGQSGWVSALYLK